MIRKLFSSALQTPVARRPLKRRRREDRHRRRMLETLESRRLLAILVTNTEDSGPGSLRAAIIQTAQTPDVIEFQIPANDPNFVDVDAGLPGGDAEADVFVISLLTNLPDIDSGRAGIRIDGDSQALFGGDTNPLGPEIVLDGRMAGGEPGLRIASPDSGVNGLVFQFFQQDALVIEALRVDVFNNFVGVDPLGMTPAANGGSGIRVTGGSDILVRDNLIAFNSGDGVTVTGATSVAIQRNSIFANGLLGIDLGQDGVTFNDQGDADRGANNLQNFPLLTGVTRDVATTVSGELDSLPDQTYVIDFYANDTTDPGGFGEGQTFLGSVNVMTDAAGLATFTVDLPLTTNAEFISATATDATGNTSEFSRTNRPPVAVDDRYNTDEDTPFNDNLIVNAAGAGDQDPDDDVLKIYAIDGDPNIVGVATVLLSGASLTVQADGQFDYDPRTSDLLNALDVGETATDSFTYTISDGLGGRDTASVLIQVVGVNDAPQPVGDTYSTDEDTTLIVNALAGVLANDVDVDGDILTALLASPPEQALTFNLAADGSFSYTPVAHFSGTDRFTYTVRDEGDNSQAVEVVLNILAVADAPTLTVQDAQGTENSPVSLDIQTALVDDDESETLTLRLEGVPDGAKLSQGVDSGGGVWQLDPTALDGLTILATDNAQFDLTVRATASEKGDSQASTVATISVDITNVAPAASIDGPTTALFDDLLTFDLAAADISPDDQIANILYEIDWNDGVSAIEQVNGDAAGVSSSHTFSLPGDYTIQVTATDKDGGQSEVVSHDIFVGYETLVRLDNSGDLVIEDVVQGGKNDALEISYDAAAQEIRILDPQNKVGNTVGAFSSAEIRVPTTDITGSRIIVRTLGGDDTVHFDHSDGAFPLPVDFDGGAAFDTLHLTGTAVVDLQHTFSGPQDGMVEADGVTINYTGLEPIDDDISATNRFFEFVGDAETIVLSDNSMASDGILLIDSTLGESVEFLAPTEALMIVARNGADVIDISGMDALFAAVLTVTTDAAEVDSVQLNSFGSAAPSQLSVNSSGNITLIGDLTTTGTASLTSANNLLQGQLTASSILLTGPVLIDGTVALQGETAVAFNDSVDGFDGASSNLSITATDAAVFRAPVGGTTALDSLSILTDSQLTIAQPVTTIDDVSIQVNDLAGDNEGFQLTAAGSLTSNSGTVFIQVGDRVELDLDSQISAAAEIIILVDTPSADAAGGAVALNGDLAAAAISVIGGADDDIIAAAETVTAPLLLDGGPGADTLVGGAGDDTIRGGDGADDLLGQGGNDVLLGGNDNDTLSDEAGFNLIIGGSGEDMVSGAAGEDIVIGSATVYDQPLDAMDPLTDILSVWSDTSLDIDARIEALAALPNPLTLDALIDDGVVDRLAGGAMGDLYFGFEFDQITPPSAADDNATVFEDTINNVLPVLENDSFAPEPIDRVIDGGMRLILADVSLPSQGGNVSINNGRLEYTPPADFFGTESFTYVINNGAPDDTSTATVRVVIENVDDDPIASENHYTTDERSEISGNLILDDTGMGVNFDPDSTEPLTLISVSPLTSGATLEIMSDGSFRYDPSTSDVLLSLLAGEQETETFTYRIEDSQEATGTGTVTIVVEGVDPALSGNIWNDLNGDSQPDPDEPGIPGVTVYLDLNRSLVLDAGELTALTDANGDYRFEEVVPGQYDIAHVTIPAFEPTFPRRRFEADTPLAAGSVARGSISGDWNGDGLNDLAVTDDAGGQVVVLLSDDLTSFSTDRTLDVGQRPQQVIATDVTGDLHEDLIVTTVGSSSAEAGNEVYVFVGDGLGNFSTPRIVPAGDGPLRVAAGDLDADGDQDLAVTNFRSRDVTLLINNGDGFFEPLSGVALSSINPMDVALADYDGDQRADLFVADFDTDSVEVLLNRGQGEFESMGRLAVADGPADVTATDVNGDAAVDLLVAGYLGNQVSVYLGNGTGSFVRARDYSVGERPKSVDVADVNRDLIPDLVVANSESGSVSILYGTGMGEFMSSIDFPSNSSPQSAVTGDWDLDGDMDVAVANLPGQVTPLINGVGVHQIVLGNEPITDLDFGNLVLNTTRRQGGFPGDTFFQNQLHAVDVDANGEVQPIDALLVLNSLNDEGPRPLVTERLAADGEAAPPLPAVFLDVSGDSFISPLDALLVINWLNDVPIAEGEDRAEFALLSPANSPGASSSGAPIPRDDLFALQASADSDRISPVQASRLQRRVVGGFRGEPSPLDDLEDVLDAIAPAISRGRASS